MTKEKIDQLIEKREDKIKEWNAPVYSMVDEWIDDLKSLQPTEERECPFCSGKSKPMPL